MNRRAEISVSVLIVLIIASLALAGGAFYLYQKEKARGAELEEKLDEISTKQRITESKLDESRKTMTDLQLKYEEAKMRIESLTSDLEEEKKARLGAEAKIAQLGEDLEMQKELRSDLEDKLSQAQKDVRSTQVQLTNLDARKAELEAKVKELEAKTQEIELGKIVVAPEIPPAPQVPAKKGAAKAATVPAAKKIPAKYQGEVLVVNKEYSFVVLSLGAKDGVKENQVFSVYRNNKYLGDVKVEKVHDTMSAAGFVTGDLKGKIREGDKLAQKV